MGTFASALTRQQIIAALIGLLIAIIFVLMYPLSKKLDAPVSTVLSLTDMWWIHFHEGFERSILNLKDVVYYIATTYFDGRSFTMCPRMYE